MNSSTSEHVSRNSSNFGSFDLSRRPPRSPRVRLGGYVILPRCLDKCRATVAGTAGEYHFNCPLDQRFFAFTGLSAEAFKNEVMKGRSDSEMLAWVRQNAPLKHAETEIAAWSERQLHYAPTTNETRAYFNTIVAEAKAEAREDIAGWFDYLDVDDFVSFGGRA